MKTAIAYKDKSFKCDDSRRDPSTLSRPSEQNFEMNISYFDFDGNFN